MAGRNVTELQDAVYNLLNPQEQREFISNLNRFQKRRNVQELVQGLGFVVNTSAKSRLLVLLRKVLPSKDVPMYDQLVRGLGEANNQPRNTYPRKHEYQIERGFTDVDEMFHRPGSTISVPATLARPHVPQTLNTGYHHSLPNRHTRSKMVRPGKGLETGMASKTAGPKMPSWEAGHMPKLKKIFIQKPEDVRESLGFSIRGGAEHGIGIYVSYVDVDSVAEKHGLVPGDQILSLNGIPFKKIFHEEAAKIIKLAEILDMDVCNMGRVPGSFETHQTYAWVDPIGRSVSPPPEVDRIGRYNNSDERKSGLMLLKDSDERKVHLVVNDNQSRGLMIRGGKEFGLGIYITSIDMASVAENAGLKVGDQLLDVNGQSFLDVTHSDAVKTIKSSQRLMLTVKDVGKLPFAQTTFDHTRWVQHNTLPRKTLSLKDYSPSLNGNANAARNGNVEAVFMRGAGSQLMHSSMSNKKTQRGMIEEQARNLLNTSERTTMNYYLNEYQQGNIEVEALSLALIELLNTHAKFQLTSEIRGLVAPRDLEKFDHLVLEKQLAGIKSPEHSTVDHISYQSIDSLSLDSRQSLSSGQESFEELDPLRIAIEQIKGTPEEDFHDLSKVDINLPSPGPLSAFKPIHPVENTVQGLPSQNSQKSIVVAEIHSPPENNGHHTLDKHYPYDETHCPSEDSGVDLNGAGSREAYHSLPLHNGHNSTVTLSTQKPVIINDSSSHKSAHHSRSSSRERNSVRGLPHPNAHTSTSLPTHNTEEQLSTFAKVVTVYKLKPTLGIAIEGGANTRQPLPKIISIQRGGSADVSGGLEVGQIILEIDGRSMLSLEHREAAKAIAEAFKNKSIKHMDFTVLPAETNIF